MNLQKTNSALLEAHNRIRAQIAELENIGNDIVGVHDKGDLANVAREDVKAALANLDAALEALRLASYALALGEEANRYFNAPVEVA